MPWRAGHPDEVDLHLALRDALNAGLSNKNFFVWINVNPTGKARQFEDLDSIVAETDGWLGGLDPDAVDGKNAPKLRLQTGAAAIEITALPRKREVRGYRADEIVGNPGPVLVGWGE